MTRSVLYSSLLCLNPDCVNIRLEPNLCLSSPSLTPFIPHLSVVRLARFLSYITAAIFTRNWLWSWVTHYCVMKGWKRAGEEKQRKKRGGVGMLTMLSAKAAIKRPVVTQQILIQKMPSCKFLTHLISSCCRWKLRALTRMSSVNGGLPSLRWRSKWAEFDRAWTPESVRLETLRDTGLSGLSFFIASCAQVGVGGWGGRERDIYI